MDSIYLTNIKRMNDKINVAKNNYLKYDRKANVADSTFFVLACLHLLVAGFYATTLVLQPMLGFKLFEFSASFVLGLLSSCATSLGIAGGYKNYCEKKKEENEDNIDAFIAMRDTYTIKRNQYNDYSNINTRSNSSYYSKKIKLSLRK